MNLIGQYYEIKRVCEYIKLNIIGGSRMEYINVGEISKYVKDYQNEAIKVIKKYLNSNSKKHCLVKLPTGTGKTGIIAIAANLNVDNVLIIVPNATLPKQTMEEIENKFWKNINFETKSLKKVKILNGSSKSEIFEEQGTIFICTIQTLLNAYVGQLDIYKEIKNKIKLILYDEGHREPAKIWSSVSRDLSKKTILFTATPYRNDSFIFNIEKRFSYKYSMKEAIKNKDVKDLKFDKFPYDEKNGDESLLKFILEIIKKDNAQIIIRCKEREKIEKIVNYINVNETYALGCHSSFENKNNLFNSGEKLLKVLNDENSYKVIVHCDMLTEGINIPSLNRLVLLDNFNNTKTIIQQIGRVLRIKEDNDAVVYVKQEMLEEIKEQWNMYLEAEENEVNYTYVDGKFRKKFLFESYEKIHEELNFPKQANVYTSESNIFDQLINSIENSISQVENLLNIKTSIWDEGKLWTLIYEKQEQSKILNNTFYFDKTLEFVSLKEIKKEDKYFYFYYDSSRYKLQNNNTIIKNVNVESLCKLVPKDANIKNVKYTSTSLYKLGAQTRTIEGMNLNNIPSSISEKLSFCRNVSGRFNDGENKIERYINPITARISEKYKCNFKEYCAWCDRIIENIFNENSNNYFSRFAQIVDKPKTDPTSIMIDFNIPIKSNTKHAEFESQFISVKNNEFKLESKYDITGKIIVGKNDKLELRIDVLKDYIIDNSEIRKSLLEITDTKEYTLDEFLKTNNFRVYFSDEQVMYYNGYYFKPNIRSHYTDNDISEFPAWSNIFTLKNLKDCKNEKLGRNPEVAFNQSISWPIDSVFGVILHEISTNHKEIDYLICDDLGYEISDFIALNSKENKVIFIHCKYKESNLSASAFQDICGQANKNIEYIMRTNINELNFWDNHIKHWEEKWSISENNKTYQANRCIKGNIGDFVNEYKRIIQNSNSTKEVWLVNSGLSKRELEKELRKPLNKKQAEQLPQLMWLIHTTMDSLSQAGSEMKIFCKE